jgi:hypothetical protein
MLSIQLLKSAVREQNFPKNCTFTDDSSVGEKQKQLKKVWYFNGLTSLYGY